MELAFKKVYHISSKNTPDTPRIWLQSLVCKQAGFEKGQSLYVSINEDAKEITIQSKPISEADTKIKVSGRKVGDGESPFIEPLVDTASKKYQKIINVRQKVEINVYKDSEGSKVIIRPLQFKLFEKETFIKNSDERISLLSICAGAGFGTAAFENSGAFKSVGAVELEDDCSEVFTHNFPSSYLFTGNLLDCSTFPKADVAFVTLPCTEASSLGHGNEGIINDLILATSEIIRAAESRIIAFENVPKWYKTAGYERLKSLLKDVYPYWSEKPLDSYDFASIARRKRVFVCAFRTQEDFLSFSFPIAPKAPRRKKLREFFDKKETADYDWKSVDTWVSNFKKRGENGGSWKDRNLSKTFVSPKDIEINCVPARYTSQSASNSYVLSDDKKHFRFLTIPELFKIFRVPSWFSYPNTIGKIRQYELIGQSLDCGLIQSIANKIAEVFYLNRNRTNKSVNKMVSSMSVNSENQLGFVF